MAAWLIERTMRYEDRLRVWTEEELQITSADQQEKIEGYAVSRKLKAGEACVAPGGPHLRAGPRHVRLDLRLPTYDQLAKFAKEYGVRIGQAARIIVIWGAYKETGDWPALPGIVAPASSKVESDFALKIKSIDWNEVRKTHSELLHVLLQRIEEVLVTAEEQTLFNLLSAAGIYDLDDLPKKNRS
jgi:hypothetical protein